MILVGKDLQLALVVFCDEQDYCYRRIEEIKKDKKAKNKKFIINSIKERAEQAKLLEAKIRSACFSELHS